MIKRIFIIIFLSLIYIVGFSQDKEAYSLFNDKGERITYQDFIDDLASKDVVFIGEMHNCPITHWLEFEITRSLYEKHKEKFMMGAEMFESDNQLILDEFLSGDISSERFEAEARLWDNYHTDYEPFLYFAKEHKIPFIATNIPRRYAARVKEYGLDSLVSLSLQAKQYIAPLPIKFKYNENEASAFGIMAVLTGRKQVETRKYAEAQSIKDATMGWFIAHSMKDKFLHINGSYHIEGKGGIIPYLLKYRPGTKIVTVISVRQENIKFLEEENKGRGDFYICVPQDMVYSY